MCFVSLTKLSKFSFSSSGFLLVSASGFLHTPSPHPSLPLFLPCSALLSFLPPAQTSSQTQRVDGKYDWILPWLQIMCKAAGKRSTKNRERQRERKRERIPDGEKFIWRAALSISWSRYFGAEGVHFLALWNCAQLTLYYHKESQESLKVSPHLTTFMLIIYMLAQRQNATRQDKNQGAPLCMKCHISLPQWLKLWTMQRELAQLCWNILVTKKEKWHKFSSMCVSANYRNYFESSTCEIYGIFTFDWCVYWCVLERNWCFSVCS